MSNIRPFSIYIAAAGAGKTHLLTQRYLSLAYSAHAPHGYRHIMAITFTNRAAEEMKRRILHTLYSWSRGTHKASAKEMEHMHGLKQKQLQSFAEGLKRNILHHYDDFGITTIDSFAHRLIQSFLLETGHYAYQHIELEAEGVLDAVVAELLADLGEDQRLTDWIERLVDEQMDSGKSWQPAKVLQGFGYQLLSEFFRKHQVQYSQGNFLEKVQLAERQINQKRTQTRQKLLTCAEGAQEVIQSLGVMADMLGKGYQNVYNMFFHKLLEGNGLPVSLDSHTLKRALGGDARVFYGKVAKPHQEALVGQLVPLFEEALELQKDLSSLEAVWQHIHVIGTASALWERIRHYRSEEELLLISDMNDLLRQLTHECEAPYIYDKVGTYVHHYLIDEFQDTSRFQWESLAPLVKDSLAQGYANLVVGDPKQSIYRWRGSTSSLIQHEIGRDIDPNITHKEWLSKNWRSVDTIVDFNNRFFSEAPNFLSPQAPYDALQKLYSVSAQEVVKKSEVGYVALEGVSKMPKKDYDKHVLESLCAQVDRWLGRGFSPQDIGILVRRRSEAQQVSEALLRHREEKNANYEILSDESLKLHQDACITFLVSSCARILHPEDLYYRFRMRHAYHIGLLKKQPNHELYAQLKAPSPLSQAEISFEKRLYSLRRLPLHSICEDLIQCFALNEMKDTWVFLEGFQALVERYRAREGDNLDGFIRYWNKHRARQKITQQAPHSGIQIMTLHAAKGLEFGVVLIPFANWRLIENRREAHHISMWGQAPKDLPLLKQLPFIGLSFQKPLMHSHFQHEYLEESQARQIDSFNLLYVGFTRAKQVLWVGYPRTSAKKGPLSVSDLLSSFAEKSTIGRSSSQEDAHLFECGDAYCSPLGDSPKKGIFRSLSAYPSHPLYQPIAVEVERRTRADLREKGERMHAYLAHIRNLNDLKKTYARIRQAEPEAIANQMIHQLKALFKLAEVQHWFSPVHRVIKVEGYLLDENGQLHRPDRVIYSDRGWEVIDFKTGIRRDQDVTQVQNYLNVLRKRETAPCSGAVLYTTPPHILSVS